MARQRRRFSSALKARGRSMRSKAIAACRNWPVNTRFIPARSRNGESSFRCRPKRSNWRRGELNPRPEIARMVASTCVVDVLISKIASAIDSLRDFPVVFVLFPDQRPNQGTSPRFAADLLRASDRAEVTFY